MPDNPPDVLPDALAEALAAFLGHGDETFKLSADLDLLSFEALAARSLCQALSEGRLELSETRARAARLSLEQVTTPLLALLDRAEALLSQQALTENNLLAQQAEAQEALEARICQADHERLESEQTWRSRSGELRAALNRAADELQRARHPRLSDLEDRRRQLRTDEQELQRQWEQTLTRIQQTESRLSELSELALEIQELREQAIHLQDQIKATRSRLFVSMQQALEDLSQEILRFDTAAAESSLSQADTRELQRLERKKSQLLDALRLIGIVEYVEVWQPGTLSTSLCQRAREDELIQAYLSTINGLESELTLLDARIQSRERPYLEELAQTRARARDVNEQGIRIAHAAQEVQSQLDQLQIEIGLLREQAPLSDEDPEVLTALEAYETARQNFEQTCGETGRLSQALAARRQKLLDLLGAEHQALQTQHREALQALSQSQHEALTSLLNSYDWQALTCTDKQL